MPLLSLEQFAQATVNVIAETPVDQYLPTFVVDGEVLALEGIPADVDHREATQRHAKKRGWDRRDFLFGVRSGERDITLGRCDSTGCEFALLRWKGGAADLQAIGRPNWWWLSPNKSLERSRDR